MPGKTAKQRRYMGMCTTRKGRKAARRKCPPIAVARKFARTPRGRKS